MTNIEEIIVRLGIDGSSLDRGIRSVTTKISTSLNNLRGSINRIGKSIASELTGQLAAIASVGAFTALIKQTIDYGGHIQDLSKQLNISAEAVQAWDYALKLSGGSIEAAASFFEKLAVSRERALKGDKAMIASFKEFNVTLDDLKNKRIEDIGEQIGRMFENGADPQQFIAALREIGGKSAGSMIPAMAEGLQKAREEAEKLGIILKNDVVAKLDEAGDRLTMISAQLKGLTGGWIAQMLEGFQILTHQFKFFKEGIAESWDFFYGSGAKKFWSGMSYGEAKDAYSKIWERAARRNWDEMTEEDKALGRAQGARDGRLADFSGEEERNELAKINASTAKITADEKLREMSAEDRLKTLQEQRRKIWLDAYNLGRSFLEMAESQHELAKIDVEIARAKEQLANEQAKAEEKARQEAEKRAKTEKEIKDAKAKQTELQQKRSNYNTEDFMPTLEELANSKFWGFNSRTSSFGWFDGPFAGEARELMRLQKDAKNARIFKDQPRLQKDLEGIRRINASLAEAGVVTPDSRLESIDEQIKTLVAKQSELTARAGGDKGGIATQPPANFNGK